MQATIELNGLEFFACHGVSEQERKVGNIFIVDISFNVDISRALSSDLIEDTVNYATVYEIIRKEMEIPSNLLEHIAGRIQASLQAGFPEMKKIKIAIAKVNPPIGGQAQNARVVITSP